MNDKELDASWAWSQIEDMADGSLRGGERRRMRRHMQADPKLQQAVNDARSVHAALRQLSRATVPQRLLTRLARIPSLAPPSRSGTDALAPLRPIGEPRRSLIARPVGVAAALALFTACAIAAAFLLVQRPMPQIHGGPSPASATPYSIRDSQANPGAGQDSSMPPLHAGASDESLEALRELDAALRYVQSSAEVTRRGVARQIGRGFIEALDISRSAFVDDDSEHKRGG